MKKEASFAPGAAVRGWTVFLSLAFIAGCVLRLIHVHDMEYKEDEQFNFTMSQIVGRSHPWPWLGIGSGVYLPNPGMSVWVFVWLGRIFQTHTATDLARALQIFSLFGILWILPFALKFVRTAQEREPWLWAFAFALVNPFAILYQRKLWPEPFLPMFSMLMLMAWWKREKRFGAFFWGLIGACLGQIHMSGFFLAGAFFLWTLLFERRGRRSLEQTEWSFWLLGSTLGALPLIPWFKYIFTHRAVGPVTTGWFEAIQLKYWVFWITDALGLHLGNALGLLRGPGLEQLSDFARYPLIDGRPTYLVGMAHAVLALGALLALIPGLLWLWRHRKHWRDLALGKDSDTAFAQSAAFWGAGVLMTFTGITIRRYYMMVTFPLEFVWLARSAGTDPARARWTLGLVWAMELFISANFVAYIHQNQGSTSGDYGQAYHLIEKTLKNPDAPWPESVASPSLFPSN